MSNVNNTPNVIDMTDDTIQQYNNNNTTIDIIFQQFISNFIDLTIRPATKLLIEQCRIYSKQIINNNDINIHELNNKFDNDLCNIDRTQTYKFIIFELLNHVLLYCKRSNSHMHNNNSIQRFDEFIQFVENNIYKYILQLLPTNIDVTQYIDHIRKIIRLWQERSILSKYALLNVLKYIDNWKLTSNDSINNINDNTIQTSPQHINHNRTSATLSSSHKHKRSKLNEYKRSDNNTDSDITQQQTTLHTKEQHDQHISYSQHRPTQQEQDYNKTIEDMRQEQKRIQLNEKLRPVNESFYSECDELWSTIAQQTVVDNKTFLSWWFNTTPLWTPPVHLQQNNNNNQSTDITISPNTPTSPVYTDSVMSPIKK